MADILLDCKGLPCPQPVLESKRCIEDSAPQVFEVLVDNDAAKENVSRFVGSQGYAARAEDIGGGVWKLTISRSGEAPAPKEGVQDAGCGCEVMSPEQLAALANQKEQICVFITSKNMGSGDDTLGAKLMENFVNTLPELGDELWRIIMVNEGVKLATKGSPVLDTLKKIEASGVVILVCGTCLDFFKLLEEKEVGQTTNMLDVVTGLQLATKIIRP